MTLDWLTLYYATEWLIRVAALVTLPPRMKPAAARAWLLLLFVLPWPGLLVFLFFGRTSLPSFRIRAREQMEEEARKDHSFARAQAEEMSDSLSSIATLSAKLGDFPAETGNRVELLPDYAAAHDAMLRDIRAAWQHVHLMTYIFSRDETGERFRLALKEAVARGVRCRVLLDGLGSGRQSRVTASRLREGGIETFILMPSSFFRRKKRARVDLRNHRKITVIDGRIGYIGSQNVVEGEVWKGHPNLELVVRVTGPLVRQMQMLFLGDRAAEAGDQVTGDDLFPAPTEAGSVTAQLLPSGPAYRSENNLEALLAALYGARRRATLATPYFIPPESLLEAMRSAAKRGVEVRLITPHWSNSLPESLAQHSFYESLLEAGVHIHMFGPQFLHAKHVSVDDDLAIIGSTNLDARSFALNAEAVALFYDRAVVEQLRRVEDGYLAKSVELTAEAWRARPGMHRVGESLCRLMDILL